MDKFVKQVNEWKPFNEVKPAEPTIKKPVFSIKCDLFGKKLVKEDLDKIKKRNFYKNDDSHIHQWKLIDPDVYHYETIDNRKIRKGLIKKGTPGKYHCVKCNKKYIVLSMCVYNGYIEMFEYFKSIATYADQNSITPLKLPYEFLFCSCVENSPYVCAYCLGRSLKPSHASTLKPICENSSIDQLSEEFKNNCEVTNNDEFNNCEVTSNDEFNNYEVTSNGEFNNCEVPSNCEVTSNGEFNNGEFNECEVTNESSYEQLKTTVIYITPKYVPWHLRPTRTQLYRKHIGLNDNEKLPEVYSNSKYNYDNELKVYPHPMFNSYNKELKNKYPSFDLKTIQFEH